MNRIVVMLMVGCLSLSCVIDDREIEAGLTGGIGDETYTFFIEQQKPELLSKSSFSRYESEVIRDINIFVYYQGRLLEKYSRYIEDLSDVRMTFPGDKDGFNIYMVGNVGKVDAPHSENEISDFVYVIDSYDDLRINGFPVANAFMGYEKGKQRRFAVKRLVGQYNIRVQQSAKDADYHIRSVRLVNCALDIYPFGVNKKASVFAEGKTGQAGDSLSEEDIRALNYGETVELVFVENMQDDSSSGRCTYMEVTAEVTTVMSRYTDVKYRCYLGQNLESGSSVRRNTVYSAVLNFTQDMMMEEGWRIEADAPKVSDVVFDKEEAMVITGAYDEIRVDAYDLDGNLMNFSTMFEAEVLSGNPGLELEKTPGSLRIYSDVPICGVYPFDREPEYMTETVRISSKETYNGSPVFVKDIKVRVYDKLFPLLIRLERQTSDAPVAIIVRGRNPMKLGLAVKSSYATYYGLDGETESFFCNGTDGAIDMQGRCVGYLDQEVLFTDLRRIDFSISGIGYSDYRFAQTCPELLKSEPLFPGVDSEATYGPFDDMYPAKCKNLPDDGKFIMKYVDDERNTVLLYGPGSPETGTFTELTDWTFTQIYNPDNSDVYFYTDADGRGVGKSKFVWHENYDACPFYVVNGGLTVKYFEVMMNKTLVEYPDKNSSYVKVLFYGSGRDLSKENGTGQIIDNTHWLCYKVSRWKDQAGKVRVLQDESYYRGLLYMTVNGASSWTGCDESEYGFFAPEY